MNNYEKEFLKIIKEQYNLFKRKNKAYDSSFFKELNFEGGFNVIERGFYDIFRKYARLHNIYENAGKNKTKKLAKILSDNRIKTDSNEGFIEQTKDLVNYLIMFRILIEEKSKR